MAIIDDINEARSNIEAIEEYVKKGAWHPDRQIEIAQKLTGTDGILNFVMVEQAMGNVALSDDQIALVSELLKRFQTARDNLPSPPWD